MNESTLIVAFDQHAASVVAAVLLPHQRTPALQELASDLPTIGRFVGRLVQRGSVRCCYEAGPCGFELQRFLQARQVACDVIAPALIPRRPGDRIKTDRRDAAQLAMLYRAGALTAIHVPTEQEEAARDLLRCREDIKADLLRARHRLSKFLLRHGRRFTGTKKAWSKRHDAWLRAQHWPIPALDQTHRAYLRGVDETHARLRSVEEDLRTLLTLEPLRPRVERLRCFRGVDDLTALTIAAELGDPRRFASAPRAMAFVGLVPSEHSSGTKQARGAITKTGNAHLRRVLVEAAWHYRHRPFVGATLRRRQQGAAAPIVAHAWTAQERLYRRYHRLRGRGKPNQQVITAVARELTGFVWAALVQ
ncbi:MAG TPA: IS110 family transposase [Rhizomicrobium sp.]|nr:IS110 family transposase [Rhizomicrobium sp.]HUK35355.1 IS110 family transposase [Vicinamibacterales bacterium]